MFVTQTMTVGFAGEKPIRIKIVTDDCPFK